MNVPCRTQGEGGSIPLTSDTSCSSKGRTPSRRARKIGFKSQTRCIIYALVAQLKERFATNEKVGGLSPSESANYQSVAGIGYGPRLGRGICRFESCHSDLLWCGQIGKASRFEREKYRFEPCHHNLHGVYGVAVSIPHCE